MRFSSDVDRYAQDSYYKNFKEKPMLENVKNILTVNKGNFIRQQKLDEIGYKVKKSYFKFIIFWSSTIQRKSIFCGRKKRLF